MEATQEIDKRQTTFEQTSTTSRRLSLVLAPMGFWKVKNSFTFLMHNEIHFFFHWCAWSDRRHFLFDNLSSNVEVSNAIRCQLCNWRNNGRLDKWTVRSPRCLFWPLGTDRPFTFITPFIPRHFFFFFFLEYYWLDIFLVSMSSFFFFLLRVKRCWRI